MASRTTKYYWWQQLFFFFFFSLKSKETYYARCQELDKFKKDGSSAREIEKVESTEGLCFHDAGCLA